jgi:hypothetical protein
MRRWSKCKVNAKLQQTNLPWNHSCVKHFWRSSSVTYSPPPSERDVKGVTTVDSISKLLLVCLWRCLALWMACIRSSIVSRTIYQNTEVYGECQKQKKIIIIMHERNFPSMLLYLFCLTNSMDPTYGLLFQRLIQHRLNDKHCFRFQQCQSTNDQMGVSSSPPPVYLPPLVFPYLEWLRACSSITLMSGSDRNRSMLLPVFLTVRLTWPSPFFVKPFDINPRSRFHWENTKHLPLLVCWMYLICRITLSNFAPTHNTTITLLLVKHIHENLFVPLSVLYLVRFGCWLFRFPAKHSW